MTPDCIPKSKVCDGYNDCPKDTSDEYKCSSHPNFGKHLNLTILPVNRTLVNII